MDKHNWFVIKGNDPMPYAILSRMSEEEAKAHVAQFFGPQYSIKVKN